MGNYQILGHDEKDVEQSKECKQFEDENVKRTKKRKLSTNGYQEDFHGKPSFAIGNKKRKVPKTIPKARKISKGRTICEFCGKNVAASWLISHIEKTNTCRLKCGEDLKRMKMEKIQEKRKQNAEYKSKNKEKVKKTNR